MRHARPEARLQLHVAIVSRNPDTIEGLESYLRGAGVTTCSTRTLRRASTLATAVSAVVLFPDDFAWDATVTTLAECRAKSPRVPFVLVTRTPQRFEALVSADAAALSVVVPKPAWSWTILDAIRAHVDEESGAANR
jgi:hypothetical protein